MKKYIFNLVATLSLFAFFISIKPTCWSYGYQPELPDELK